MKYVDVRLRLPDRLLHPIQAFIRTEDAVRYEEILIWDVRPDEDVEYALYYVEGDLERYREAVDDVESILEYRLAPIDEASAHVWACEESRPEVRTWREAFAGRHLIVMPPIRFDAEAAMGMTIVGHGEDIQAVLSDLPAEVDVTVTEVGTYDRRGGTLAGALTDRQREAVATALELGYYEVPRENGLEAIAERLDCAESTASVLLRRAERELFSRVLERYGGSLDPVEGA